MKTFFLHAGCAVAWLIRWSLLVLFGVLCLGVVGMNVGIAYLVISKYGLLFCLAVLGIITIVGAAMFGVLCVVEWAIDNECRIR